LKRLSVIVIVACVSMTAFAQGAKKKNTGLIGKSVESNSQSAAYGMAGCGLGSVLFGETESRGGQILAATTNGIYGNDTFAMSSGTSNCVPENSASTAAMRKNMDMFVAANRESLANDIAKSNGETIVTISNIMGCKDSDYLGAKLQGRYETIFSSKEDSVVAEGMINTVASDRYLAENCKL
jgi:hypothetical protein